VIIAGDIGGTKTNLALFSEKEGYDPIHFATYPSKNYPDLYTVVSEFISSFKNPYKIEKACFAIAGPIVENVCKTTNLPWIVDGFALSEKLNIPTVYLLNDLEANTWAMDILPAVSLVQLYEGRKPHIGNRAVVSPGTGLGEAATYWDGTRHNPFASEGGHCEFGPRNPLQMDLCRYLYERFGHVSYERILSGPGLYNVYQFYKEILKRPEPSWLAEELKQGDPARRITQHALAQKAEICVETLNLFVSILGAEAANCALKFMARGGVYLGGGIPPKILPKLKEPFFLEGFFDKGRFRELLERISVQVIIDDKASLKGAAHFCRVEPIPIITSR
jgi:glucokinase